MHRVALGAAGRGMMNVRTEEAGTRDNLTNLLDDLFHRMEPLRG